MILPAYNLTYCRQPPRKGGCERASLVLKWPGGKTWNAEKLATIFKSELKCGAKYIEPFLGGGAVFYALKPDRAILSDINPALVEFVTVLRHQPKDLLRCVWRYSNDHDTYYRVRASNPRTALARAARFLYLNRTCWGGIYRENKKGEFNVPFGNSGRCICRKNVVLNASVALQNAEIYCCDFESSMSLASIGDVVYLDPPYSLGFGKEAFSRYNAERFQWKDHLRLASLSRSAARKGAFVCISAAMDDRVLEKFKGWWLVTWPRLSLVSRNPKARFVVNEAFIFNRHPSIPFGLAEQL